MWELLHQHSQIILGMERYTRTFHRKIFPAELFDFERFFDFRKDDTFYDLTTLPTLEPRYEEMQKRVGTARLIGDKNPYYYQNFDLLLDTFPNARIVFMLRNVIDVANSYQQRVRRGDPYWNADRDYRLAIREWNESLAAVQNLIVGRSAAYRLLIVTYEDFFASSHIDKLCAFLDISVDEDFRQKAEGILLEGRSITENRSYALDSFMIREIVNNADISTYKKLVRSEASLIGNSFRDTSPPG